MKGLRNMKQTKWSAREGAVPWIPVLVSCTIKALVCCNSGSRLGGCFPVSVTAHVLSISSMCKYNSKGDNAD